MKTLLTTIIPLVLGFCATYFGCISIIDRPETLKNNQYPITKKEIAILMQSAYLQGYRDCKIKRHHDTGWRRIQLDIDTTFK